MTTIPMALTLAALLATTASPAEDAPPTARLISFDSLQQRMDAPSLRLLDARPRADYERGHLPGAVWVDARTLEEKAARPGALTDRDAWASWIRPLGIGPETEVYVYDSQRQLQAARVWWILTYLGVEKAGLVDGSFPLWEAQGRPVSAEAPAVEPVAFDVSFRSGRHATKEEVLKALEGKAATIVDARSRGEYAGEDKRSSRGGHVPSACRVEWNELVTKDGRFLDEPALRAKLQEAGVASGAPVIAHCQGGGRASVNAFVLERLGYPTRNYYLGWSDWGNAADTPVQAGEDRPPRR